MVTYPWVPRQNGEIIGFIKITNMKELELKHAEAIEIVSEQKKEQTLLGRTRSFNDGRKFYYLDKGKVHEVEPVPVVTDYTSNVEEPMKSRIDLPIGAPVVKALNLANAKKKFTKMGLHCNQ